MNDFDYFFDDKNNEDSIFDSLDIDFDFDYINHTSINQAPSNVDSQILSSNIESIDPIILDNKGKIKSTKPAKNNTSSSSTILTAQTFATQQDIRKTYKKWTNSEDRCLISEIKNQLLNGHINNQTADFTASIEKVSKLLQRPFQDCKNRYHAYFVASSKSKQQKQQKNSKNTELKKKNAKNNHSINTSNINNDDLTINQQNNKTEDSNVKPNIIQNHYKPPLPEQNLIQRQTRNTVSIDEANLKFLSSTFQDPSLTKLLSALASPNVRLSMPRQKDDSTIFSSNYTSTIKHNQQQLLSIHHSSPNLLKSEHEWVKNTSIINNVAPNKDNNTLHNNNSNNNNNHSGNNINNDNNEKIIDKVIVDDAELKTLILSPTPTAKSEHKSANITNKNSYMSSSNLSSTILIDTSEQTDIENNELKSILLSPTPIANSKRLNRTNNESISKAIKFPKLESDDNNNNNIANSDHIENEVNNNNNNNNNNNTSNFSSDNINDTCNTNIIIDKNVENDVQIQIATSNKSTRSGNKIIYLPSNINTADQLDIDNNELISIILAPTPLAACNSTHFKQPEGIYNAANNNIKFTSDIIKSSTRSFLPPPVDVTQYDLDISETIMLPTPLNATPIIENKLRLLNNGKSPIIETSPSDPMKPSSTTSTSSSNSSSSSTYSAKFFPKFINSNTNENSKMDASNNGLIKNTDINSIPIPVVVVDTEYVSKKSTQVDFFDDDSSSNNLVKKIKLKKSNLTKSITDNSKPIEIKTDEGTKLLSLDKICRQLIENFGCKIEMLHAIPEVNIDSSNNNSNQPIIHKDDKIIDLIEVVKSDNNDCKKRKFDFTKEIVKDRGEYRVETIANLLQVHTRRIYDVLKILECLTIVTKPLGDGSFSWNGLSNLVFNLGVEQQEGIKLFPLMALTKGLIDKKEYDRITSETNKIEKNSDFSTQRLCKLFLQLYLVGYNDMSSSASFSNLVTDESVDLKDQKTITKIRRMYDISTIFSSLGFLNKRKVKKSDIKSIKSKQTGDVSESGTMFSWCSYDIFYIRKIYLNSLGNENPL